MNSKRILDALKQIPFQVMFLCLSGLIAIFVMIIPDYISKALMWFSEGMTAKLGVGPADISRQYLKRIIINLAFYAEF